MQKKSSDPILEDFEERIQSYVSSSQGLEVLKETGGNLRIAQSIDGKTIEILENEVHEVLIRQDNEDKDFLQVNFVSGYKILVTDNLIGFKPMPREDLDMARLPKVVTTPDLQSVVEAIQDALSAEGTLPEEIDVLKKVFDSVIRGGEQAGFDLTEEKTWIQNLHQMSRPVCA